ncbi:hypothetical protein [Nitrosococcus oceani]|uniref:hypothetical protein n=1 Tax=Nitrosococcus oceani TaxID=1229 RepID=UPI0004E898AF|nr:hypothetical protein [Nitrosococcus oceani]KFI21486.1 hypothetical protein HW44_14685 [Nitrosococcus oceani]
MHPFKYYTIRRLNPYLGVLQVIDAGKVRVYSSEGKTWRPRRVAGSERFWSETDIGGNGYDRAEVSKSALTKAIEHHPPLPFPAGDRLELWLLRKATGLPLALLNSCHWEHDMAAVTDPAWRAFPPGATDFEVPGLAATRGARHRDMLEWWINDAARPLPAAQWFQRDSNGAGTGLDGLRIEPAWRGRILPALAFPELLLDERWEREETTQLVQGYHDWHGALLLAHGNLPRNTRQRLEKAAQKRPDMLLESHLMLPEVLDSEALKVALVAARLMQTL